MSATDPTLWDTIDELRASDPRYRREAYLFVVAALGATVQELPAERLEDVERRHLSGQELLEGVVRLAHQEFGPLASTVFTEWGLGAGEDIGHIVFQLVRSGQLSARPEDSLEDFQGGHDLHQRLMSDPETGPDSGRPRRRRTGKKAGPELNA